MVIDIEAVRVILKGMNSKTMAVNMGSIVAWEILAEEKQEKLFDELNNLPDKQASLDELDNLAYDTVIEKEEFEWKQQVAKPKAAPVAAQSHIQIKQKS